MARRPEVFVRSLSMEEGRKLQKISRSTTTDKGPQRYQGGSRTVPVGIHEVLEERGGRGGERAPRTRRPAARRAARPTRPAAARWHRGTATAGHRGDPEWSHAVGADGVYSALTRFEKDTHGGLVGSLELPMPVGLVGGATTVHPVAQAAVKTLDVTTASELAEIVVAVGLAQNPAGLRVLGTEGVQRGHMSLHARNVAISAGATTDELDHVVQQMVAERNVRAEYAAELREKSRKGTAE